MTFSVTFLIFSDTQLNTVVLMWKNMHSNLRSAHKFFLKTSIRLFRVIKDINFVHYICIKAKTLFADL